MQTKRERDKISKKKLRCEEKIQRRIYTVALRLQGENNKISSICAFAIFPLDYKPLLKFLWNFAAAWNRVGNNLKMMMVLW